MVQKIDRQMKAIWSRAILLSKNGFFENKLCCNQKSKRFRWLSTITRKRRYVGAGFFNFNIKYLIRTLEVSPHPCFLTVWQLFIVLSVYSLEILLIRVLFNLATPITYFTTALVFKFSTQTLKTRLLFRLDTRQTTYICMKEKMKEVMKRWHSTRRYRLRSVHSKHNLLVCQIALVQISQSMTKVT